MPLFSVTVSRIVCDVVENTIEIEAADVEAAKALALEQYAEGELELYYKGPAWDVDEYAVEAHAREVTEE